LISLSLKRLYFILHQIIHFLAHLLIALILMNSRSNTMDVRSVSSSLKD